MNARNRLEGQQASPCFDRLNGIRGAGNTHVSCQLTPSRPFLFKMLSRLILGRTRKFIHPPWYKLGGGGSIEPLPRVFDVLQYFETILPSVESLWSSEQDEVYFMGCGAAGGLWRGFYQELEIRLKSRLMVIFVLDMWKNINKHLAWFHPQVLLLLLKKVEKTYIFTKIKWLNHLLLITSYLVTIVIDHH